ncbi:ribonuclease H-like domain-containing protein [Tanacetum coccineum]|uniref:Ribonuclease H-like domain-containing protein n=1 Tax=Tanacetum coccineum TaxID=301880 RepID=A0ABQ4ZA82_9ASTR
MDTGASSHLADNTAHGSRDPHWKEAMLDEYNALISNGTWALVPRPTNVNMVCSMWLFKHKFKADGSLSRGSGGGWGGDDEPAVDEEI